MSDVLLLMKLRYINFWRINELRHANDAKIKKQVIGRIVGTLILLLLLGVYAVALFALLAECGLTSMIAPLGYTASTAIIFVFSLFRAASVLYDNDAFNILVPMPISKTAIVAERFISMYLEDFLFGLGIMLIAVIVTAVNVVITPTFIIVVLIATLLLPLLPLTLSAILGSVVSLIGGRMKHKTAVKTVLTLLFVLGILGLNFYTNSLTPEELEGVFGKIAQNINGAFLSRFFASAIEGDFLPFALLSLGEIALFAVMLVFAGKFFLAISASMSESYSGKKFRKTEMKGSSSFAALLKRELKMYFSSSVYVTNTIMSTILCVAGCVACIIFERQIYLFIAQFPVSVAILSIAVSYILTLSPASAAAISLEGKYIYILKTMPVKDEEVYNSKLAVSFIILLPGFLASAIILPVLFAGDVFEVLALILIPLATMTVTVLFGLKLDQKHYNVKWKYEAEVVKRGLPILLCMIVGFLATAVSAVAVIFLKPLWLATLLITIVSAVVSVLTYRSIKSVPLSSIE